MLPERVQRTLNLGHPVAAKLASGEPGWTAWLFVRPVIRREATWDALRKGWSLDGEAAQRFEPPAQFVVRYTRLSDAHLEAEERDDLDVAMRTNPPEDWVVLAQDLETVERILSHFLDDLEGVRLPAAVDYPEPPPEFARERSAADVLGAA